MTMFIVLPDLKSPYLGDGTGLICTRSICVKGTLKQYVSEVRRVESFLLFFVQMQRQGIRVYSKT